MFTDMVGFTALTQSNESQSLEVLQRHNRLLRPFFPKFNGREVKAIGDSFLVEFDSALDATNCAVEIQRYLHDYNISSRDEWKITLRIGIHLGDVVHSADDIFGDAVNIASRLQPLAEPEGICLSDQVFGQVRNKIPQSLEKIAPQDLKGVRFPVDVYRVVMPWEKSSLEEARQLDSKRIAVLPFSSMSPDPNDEYFADGLTEELIDRLCQIRGLEVIARTSVMNYKKKEKNASQIGNELKAGALIEGSVRKAGNKIRVTAQLINANTEGHLWSSHYDGNLDDIFAVQSEIAEKVAKELRVQLVESEKEKLEKRPTSNTEAYTLYLKGRYYWNERTEPSVRKGIECLQKATMMDPKLAVAYSDLADAYTVMADHAMMRSADAYQKVSEYASKALEIDPTLSQPHAALANVYERSYDWARGEHEYELAVELNPNNAVARHWHALSLFFKGREKEAMQEWIRARELDPLSLIVGCTFGYILVRTGSKDEGLEMLRSVIEMNDSFALGHRQLAHSYVILGRKVDAIEEVRKLQGLNPGTEMLVHIAAILASCGLKKEAIDILDRLVAEQSTKFVDVSRLAMVHAALGDETRALDLLERAVEMRTAGVPYLLSNFFPYVDSIRNTPRFRRIVARAGL
jgi:adenylate cyclase